MLNLGVELRHNCLLLLSDNLDEFHTLVKLKCDLFDSAFQLRLILTPFSFFLSLLSPEQFDLLLVRLVVLLDLFVELLCFFLVYV